MRKVSRQRLSQLRHPGRNAARKMVHRAIRSGKLLRLPCEACGKSPAEAHHEDYSLPLVVRFLCPAHHAAAHRLSRTGDPHPSVESLLTNKTTVKRMLLRLPAEQHEKLRQLAFAQRRTQQECLAEAVDLWATGQIARLKRARP